MNETNDVGNYASTDLEKEAISIVRGEKQRWEVATAFVTDRVSFKMRQLIRILRKNYYGIFDKPIDEVTNLEKIWYPLTETQVEAVVKNIDLDQKDIQFRAKTPSGYELTDITRAAVKEKLSKMQFGQKLDDFERQLAIDGTAVWKTWEEQGKLRVELVDLLNIYIDPTTPSIQEAYRFTERSLMFPEEMKSMKGWINTKDLDENVTEGLPRTDPYYSNRTAQVTSNVRMWDVYELWGKIPKYLITGKKEDKDVEVEGHIVCSGIDSPGKERVHLIELNTKSDSEGNFLKPYEECWYTRVPNRWYGRGVAEKLLMLQVYANIVFNVRINRSRVSQLGLFKIRKGAGITPQMLARLPANGSVVLNNMDDLQQLVVQEVGATSYKDEDVINTISERLTNAFEVATGEQLPASTPATNAALQSAAAKSGFSLIKDQIGHFLARWMDRHALPIIAKELTVDEVVRLTTDEGNFGQLVERVVMYKALQALDSHFGKGYIPNPQELQNAIDSAREKLGKSDMFIQLVRNVIADELETDFFVTNEEMDVSVTIANLMQLLQAAPQYSDAITRMATDLMGLGQLKQNATPQPQGLPQGAPQPQGIPNPQQIQTNALTR